MSSSNGECFLLASAHRHHSSILLPLPQHRPPPSPLSYTRRNPCFPFPHFRRRISIAQTIYSPNSASNVNYDVDDDDDEEEEEEFWNNQSYRRRWWSGQSNVRKAKSRFWEEFIDSVWILKVFKSFGWWLPAIIASFLLTTGPKAFLMALALPIGQSAVSLAFEKLWNRTESKSKRKTGTRRKHRSNADMENAEEDNPGERRRGSMGYQTWLDENDGSVNVPNFGGWADLDRAGSMQRRPSRMSSRSARTPGKKAKLSRKERRSDKPLLLRLVIAVFPFLNSWTTFL